MARHGTARHDTAQHDTSQHSMTRHSTCMIVRKSATAIPTRTLSLSLVHCRSHPPPINVHTVAQMDSFCHTVDRWYAPAMYLRSTVLLAVVRWDSTPLLWMVALQLPALTAFYYAVSELKAARSETETKAEIADDGGGGGGGRRRRWVCACVTSTI